MNQKKTTKFRRLKTFRLDREFIMKTSSGGQYALENQSDPVYLDFRRQKKEMH